MTFKYTIVGLPGGRHIEYILEGGYLCVYESDGFPLIPIENAWGVTPRAPERKRKTRVKVSDTESWSKLVAFLNRCTWAKEYDNSFILDGSWWYLTAAGDGFSIDSSGKNDWPEDFEAFRNLLREALKT